MSTVTKLGVYGLAVAAAFAVAFAVLVTAPQSSPVIAQTATDNDPQPDVILEAYTESNGGADDSDDTNDVAAFQFITDATDDPDVIPNTNSPSARAGETIYIQVTDLGPNDGDSSPPAAGSTSTLFRFTVSSAGESTGTFKASGTNSLNCADGRTLCDLDMDNDDIIVEFNISSDASANTSVVLNVENVQDEKNQRIVIQVTGTPLGVSGINVNLAGGSSVSRPAKFTGIEATGEAVFEWGVQDNQSDGADDCRTDSTCIVGQDVLFTVTGATFRSTGTDPACSAGSTSCTVKSDANGGWVQVRGSGAPGVAKLTVVAAGFTVTKDITFYGNAKKITAEAEQNSIEPGGSVFIVVTVTDGAGNGIGGRSPDIGTGADSIKGPSTNAVRVTAVDSEAKDPAGTANDIPACATGTNAKGKCVIQVTAPNPSGTANDAARGDHVITIKGAAPIATADRKVQVTITVAGAVNAVNAEAPDRVDPGSTTEIVLTVVDDEGVRAGAQSITVTKIAGDGVLRNGETTLTKDGQHTVTYRAASRVGTAEFDVQVRAPTATGAATNSGKVLASASFTIMVGEEEPEEPPAPPAPEPVDEPWFTPSPTGVAGYVNSIFRGGSLSDLQGALLDECSNNGVAAYVTRGGVHVPYIAGARVSAANAAFRSSVVVDGMVPASTIFLIAGCDA